MTSWRDMQKLLIDLYLQKVFSLSVIQPRLSFTY